MKLILDIGNTRMKAAVIDSGTVVECTAGAEPQSLQTERLCSQYGIEGAIASVVGRAPDFSALLPTGILKHFHLLSHTSRLPIGIDYETPQTLGMDRVAAAVGARQLCPKGALLIVDAGSCITVDLLDDTDVFRGGAILPGIEMRLRAMHQHTASLPAVELSPDEWNGIVQAPLTGKSTRASMTAGVLRASCFEIVGFMREYRNIYPDVKLFLTGGDAVFFAKQLIFPNFANPNLVYIGLEKILEINMF